MLGRNIYDSIENHHREYQRTVMTSGEIRVKILSYLMLAPWNVNMNNQ